MENVLHGRRFAAVGSRRAFSEIGGALAGPAGLGYAPVPLNTSYANVPLEVEGVIPDWVDGTLFRGAPGYWPDGWWLDGLITLNAFKIRAGRVLYSMEYHLRVILC